MGEEVEFGLTRSHVTAIPRFAMRLHLKHKSAPASARSRNPRKSVFSPTPHKIKTGLTNVSPFL